MPDHALPLSLARVGIECAGFFKNLRCAPNVFTSIRTLLETTEVISTGDR